MTAVFAIALSKAALKKYVYSQGYLLVCSKIRFTEIEFEIVEGHWNWAFREEENLWK